MNELNQNRNFELYPQSVLDELCPCCGMPCKSLTGYVDEGVNIIRCGYVISLIENNVNHDLLIALGIGDWGDDSSRDTRLLVCCSVKFSKEGERVYTYLNPQDTGWKNDKVLGIPVPVECINEEIETESKLLLDFILDAEKRFSELQLN